MRTASLGLGILGLLLPAGCSCRRGCAPEPAVSQAPHVDGVERDLAPEAPGPLAAVLPVPRHASTVGDLLCINEAVSVPERFVRRREVDAITIAALLEDDARLARSVGAATVRANSANYPYLSWHEWQAKSRAQDRTDRYLALVQQAGIDPIVVIGPWPGNQTANYTERYVPDDLEAYAAWVQRVVERYDGDGVDDAPGLLRPVLFWEVDNEPDLHNSVVPRNAKREVDPASFETPEQYARVLVATSAAIHAAQPDAVVLNGGTFHTGRDGGRRYLERVLAQPGAAAAVDALSIHAYFEERTPELFLAALDNAEGLAAGRPVFITETGVPSSRKGSSWLDESFQARMLVFVYGEALARGIERVCWHTLADPPSGPASSGGFASHSLHRTVGEGRAQAREPKLSGVVFQRLSEQVGDVPLSELRPVALAEGRAVRLGGVGWLVYDGQDVVLPLDAGVVVDLISGTEAPYTGVVSAPALVRPATEE